MRNKIVYSKWTFNHDAIASISIHTASSPLSNLLEADTFTAVVKTTDRTITSFTKNTPLRYYHRDVQRFLAYIQSVEREGPNKYRLTGTSAIGLLMDRLHKGGIYTGQTAETVIREIVGNISFTLKASFKTVPLYGWLPYAKPPERSARDNLCQALFALGCSVRSNANGGLIIEPLSNTVAGSIGSGSIFSGASVKYGAPVSSVVVTEHQYMQGGEETKLFEGTASAGDIITFSEPVYGLKATGFTIQESNANYAKLSGGTGVLTGRKYIHNTRQVTRTVASGAAENMKSISDATLVSVVNSGSAADRAAAYYRCLETIQCGVVLGTQTAGNMLNIYHPYNKNTVKACVESIDIAASGILRGDVKALVGYTRPQNTILLDKHLLITSSGTVTLPDGVTQVRAILIGGGTGGTGGANGENGGAGSNTSASSSSGSYNPTITKGAPGRGGAGGKKGSGGSGGKIAVFDITGSSIKTITASIGAGGSGGASNGGAGSAGGDTTLKVNGATYSSASGSPSASGYQDLVAGTIYGTQGEEGQDGSGGGAGGAPTTSEGVTGENGSSAGPNNGGTGGKGSTTGSGSQYATGTGGGGGAGAAYSAPGGAGGTGTGTRAGAGGKGAAGTKPGTPSRAGSGGNGGNGGGGGGGGGGTLAAAMNGGRITVYGGAAGAGGAGSQGGNGAAGCIILYYGVKTVVE